MLGNLISDTNIPSKDDFAFYFAWKSRIEEEEEKEKGAGNEQDTVSPDMRIFSMILKMDLMVMISKTATVHRKEDTVNRDMRILSMILDLMVMRIKIATQ